MSRMGVSKNKSITNQQHTCAISLERSALPFVSIIVQPSQCLGHEEAHMSLTQLSSYHSLGGACFLSDMVILPALEITSRKRYSHVS